MCFTGIGPKQVAHVLGVRPGMLRSLQVQALQSFPFFYLCLSLLSIVRVIAYGGPTSKIFFFFRSYFVKFPLSFVIHLCFPRSWFFIQKNFYQQFPEAKGKDLIII